MNELPLLKITLNNIFSRKLILSMSSLIITTIQADLKWEDKAANLSMFENKIKSIDGKSQIVILPEMFTTGFSMNPSSLAEDMNGTTLNWMKRVCRENKIILTGSIIIKENNQYFNRLIWMMPNAEYYFYDKRHLFAYAEEDKHYHSGNKRLITSVNGWKINLQICYDLRFPVWGRQQISETENGMEPEYDVLIYVANWPAKRRNAWKTLLCARAIENQCYVIGVNRVGMDYNHHQYSGNTMIIDPLGEILYHKEEEEDINTITLNKKDLSNIRISLPFLSDADSFIIHN